MKKILLVFGIILALSACEETNEEKTETCQSLTTVAEWPTIDFKTNFTIQVPADYKFEGFYHYFEGNSFHKESADGKIILESNYGTWTHRFEFGYSLPDTIPTQNQLRTINGELLLLDHRESFCEHGEIVGYLYYSMWQVCNGQLYWKVNNEYLAALELEFPPSELETIRKIIRTIKPKQS